MIAIPKKTVGDFSLPAIGLGTYGLGGKTIARGKFGEADPNNDNQRDINAIRSAVKLGYSHIDTAESYAEGFTEELICQAIQDIDRKTLFITSKVTDIHLKYDDVIAACRGSLKRLAIDYLDLYLIHRPNLEIPIAETLKAMATLFEEGSIKHIGVSNFTAPLLEEALAATRYPIVSNQIHYSLIARDHEDNGTIDFCRKHNILVTAYRPTAWDYERGGLDPYKASIMPLAEKYHKTPSQIALNWVISQPGVVTLAKSSNPDHLRENLGAIGWQMSAEDYQNLDKDFPRGETMQVYFR